MNNSRPKIGILGIGWVGGQVKRYFEEIKGYKPGVDLMLFDRNAPRCAGDVAKADVIFVTLPTPRDPKTGACDVSIIDNVLGGVLRKVKDAKIVVIRSTVPPGTTESFQKKYPKHKFLFNPEFLTESRAWEDMLRPDRQIIGFTDQSLDAANLVLSLLPKAPFMSPWGTNTYNRTRITATEAEIIKYAGNVYFSQKVNWANALAMVSEKLGVEYENVRQGIAADHRIGDSHLDVYHGGYRGFGGYCFPKDAAAFMHFAKEKGLSEVHQLLSAMWKFNENLLASQGLSVDDVSKHIDKIAIAEKIKAKQKKVKRSN